MSSYFTIAKDSASSASYVYTGKLQPTDSVDSLTSPAYKVRIHPRYCCPDNILFGRRANINCRDQLQRNPGLLLSLTRMTSTTRPAGSEAWRGSLQTPVGKNTSGTSLIKEGHGCCARGTPMTVATYTNQGPFSEIQGMLAVEASSRQRFPQAYPHQLGTEPARLLMTNAPRTIPKLISTRYPHKGGEWMADGFYSATNRGGLDFAGIASGWRVL
ncbi:hypothetical protein DL89DRAFT_268833, partial [Linderina pennispora]